MTHKDGALEALIAALQDGKGITDTHMLAGFIWGKLENSGQKIVPIAAPVAEDAVEALADVIHERLSFPSHMDADAIARSFAKNLSERGFSIVPNGQAGDEKLDEAVAVLDKFTKEHNPYDVLDHAMIGAIPVVRTALQELTRLRAAQLWFPMSTSPQMIKIMCLKSDGLSAVIDIMDGTPCNYIGWQPAPTPSNPAEA